MRIANGELLTDICNEEGMPDRTTVIEWKRREETGKDFSLALARAREEQQHTFADELLKVARDGSKDLTPCVTERLDKGGNITAIVTETKSDNTTVQRHRLICDQLWRLMQVLNATAYGQRDKIELTGKDGSALTPVLNITITKKE